jgi:hypothetical protein
MNGIIRRSHVVKSRSVSLQIQGSYINIVAETRYCVSQKILFRVAITVKRIDKDFLLIASGKDFPVGCDERARDLLC